MTEVAKSVTGGAPADERSRVNEQETLKKCFYCAHVAVSVVLYLSSSHKFKASTRSTEKHLTLQGILQAFKSTLLAKQTITVCMAIILLPASEQHIYIAKFYINKCSFGPLSAMIIIVKIIIEIICTRLENINILAYTRTTT